MEVYGPVWRHMGAYGCVTDAYEYTDAYSCITYGCITGTKYYVLGTYEYIRCLWMHAGY